MNKVLGVSALVIMAALGLAIWLHGNARFDAGEKSCLAEQATASVTAGNDTAKNLERRAHETHNMDDGDVDRDLHDLGIMRDANDR